MPATARPSTAGLLTALVTPLAEKAFDAGRLC